MKMLRRLLPGAVALVLIGTVAGGLDAQQTTRVAYLNLQRIMLEAPGAAEAQRTFEREMVPYQVEVDSLEVRLDRMRAGLEATRQSVTLSASARQQREQEQQGDFQAAVTAYQQRVTEIERIAQQRREALVEPIMRRISEAVEEVRREGGFALIFDVSTGAVITGDPDLDLTERVLTRLRRAAAVPAR